MARTPMHPIFSSFIGHADLESPEHGVGLPQVAVQFDAQRLEFVIFIPATNALVECLAQERISVPLVLRGVSLHDTATDVRLRAAEFHLYRQNALSEWPECYGLDHAEFCEEDDGLRRLVLAPKSRMLQFHSDELLSDQHPYQLYYADACSGLGSSHSRECSYGTACVLFSLNVPRSGIVCAYSASDFTSGEERIHAALMLSHGRNLPIVLRVAQSQISFYGHRSREQLSYLPLVGEKCSQLMDALVSGFLGLSDREFQTAYIALKYFLAGKQADIWLEVRYMLLMTCIEAMDGEETRVLRTDCTAAMLGVSDDAARLFNGMRNKLVHGCGASAEAFAAFLGENSKHGALQLEPALLHCLVSSEKLDFSQLWLRLCERLDAFWCAYLKVRPNLASCRWSPTTLMPAVDLTALALVLQKTSKERRVASTRKAAEVKAQIDAPRTGAKRNNFTKRKPLSGP